MKKTVLFFLLLLGFGVSLFTYAEDYCAQSANCHSTPLNPLQICADLKRQCAAQQSAEQQNATSSSPTTTQNNINSSNNYDLEVANCLNEYVNEYKTFRIKSDTALAKGNYQDVLIYINNMQDYLVNMKNSICYDTSKSNFIKTYNTLGEIYKSISKIIEEEKIQDKPIPEDPIDPILQNLLNNIEVSELQEAITWMYNNGLTSLKTVSTFMGEEYLTREQASKFFVQFGKKMLGKVVDGKKEVKLGDLKKANGTLQSYIKEANQLGLFKGVNGNFLPFNKLTRAQAIAVIIRANNGQQNEKTNPWYVGYYNIINNYGLLTGLSFDLNSLDSTNIKRKEVALLLYRLNNYISSDDSSIKLCQQLGGEFSTSDGSLDTNGAYNCFCKEGYSFSKKTNTCITANQNCQEYYGEYSYYYGTLNSAGSYNCGCKEGSYRSGGVGERMCIKK